MPSWISRSLASPLRRRSFCGPFSRIFCMFWPNCAVRIWSHIWNSFVNKWTRALFENGFRQKGYRRTVFCCCLLWLLLDRRGNPVNQTRFVSNAIGAAGQTINSSMQLSDWWANENKTEKRTRVSGRVILFVNWAMPAKVKVLIIRCHSHRLESLPNNTVLDSFRLLSVAEIRQQGRVQFVI